MSIVTIIGSGMMGSALVFPASANGHVVRLVGTPLDREIIDTSKRTGRHPKFTRDFPPGVHYFHFEEAERAISGADLVICGVSSFGVDWFADQVLPLIPEDMPVLSVTKGLIEIEGEGLISYPEYWSRRAAPRRMRLNAVGGPCTSYELVAEDQTVVTFCGDDLALLRRLRAMLETSYYHINVSTDVMGVESAVALKNALAVGVTVAIGANERLNGVGCEPHYNSQAAVFGQATREMQALLKLLVGNDRALSVGIGDLYVTVYGGRTRLLGILLGRGFTYVDALKELKGVTLESTVIGSRIAAALRGMAARGVIRLEDFPLFAHIGDVFLDNKPACLPWDRFVDSR